MPIPDTPITREEAFLAAANGQSVTLPEPITREEAYLHEIATKMSGGGGTGTTDYEKLENKPILVKQTTYENDQTGATGMLIGQTIYKIADTMVQLDEMIGGTVNGRTALTETNVMDLTSVLAAYGATCNVVAYSMDNFVTQTGLGIVSCDGPIAIAAMYTNVPGEGVWALGSITSLALKPVVDIPERYAPYFLPETTAANKGQTVQVDFTGKLGIGAAVPVDGYPNWREVKRNIMLGRGPTLYPVHTVFNVYSKKRGSVAFEVAGYDVYPDPDGNQAHTCVLHCLEGLFRDSQSYAFAERGKLCNLPSQLPAGTYHVDIGALSTSQDPRSGVTWSDDTFSWTLAQAVPSGGYLAFDIDYYNTWDPLTITSYAHDGTVIETATVLKGDNSGTDITTVVASGYFNFGMRARYGSGNWQQSAVRQFLNADGTFQFSPATDFDLAPNYDGDQGFLADLDPEFVQCLLEVEITTGTNQVWEAGDLSIGSSYTTRDKMFLPSYTEVGGEAWSSQAAEGTLWDAYDGLSAGEELARVKFRAGTPLMDENARAWWWLRSPDSTNPSNARAVDRDGDAYRYSNAYYRDGALAPACVI